MTHRYQIGDLVRVPRFGVVGTIVEFFVDHDGDGHERARLRVDGDAPEDVWEARIADLRIVRRAARVTR